MIPSLVVTGLLFHHHRHHLLHRLTNLKKRQAEYGEVHYLARDWCIREIDLIVQMSFTSAGSLCKNLST